MATSQNTDNSYDRIHKKTWSKRTAGFLAGATMFGAFGAVGGIIASVLPAALFSMAVPGATEAAIPAIGAILGNAAIFGGAAAWLGIGIGADVGANAGAVNAGIEEQSIRKGHNAGKGEQPAKPPKMLNWKTSLVMGVLFAAFGAIAAMSPITAPAIALMGFKAGTIAASVAGAAVIGMLGTTMGVNFAHISNKLSNGYTKILNGSAFEKSPAPELTAAPAIAAQKPTHAHAPEQEQEKPTRSFAAQKANYLSNIIEKTDDRTTEVVLTR